VDNIFLDNPSGREVASTELLLQGTTTLQSINNLNTASTTNNISIMEAEKLLKDYKDFLAFKNPNNSKIESPKKPEISTTSSNEEDVMQLASVAMAGNSSSTKGFWTKLIAIPVNGIKSIIHIFYNF
jgi:hypothetical protein